MEFDREKRTGFLGDFAWKGAKDKEVPIHKSGTPSTASTTSFQAVWPEVREWTPILVVLVRDPRGKFKDKHLFTTDLNADLGWIMAAFSARQSSKRQLTPSRPQRPTCVNYSTTWKTT